MDRKKLSRWVRICLAAVAWAGFGGGAFASDVRAAGPLESAYLRALFDARTGGLGRVRGKQANLAVVDRIVDRYEIETRAGTRTSTETADQVRQWRSAGPRRIEFDCINKDLPELKISKIYRLDASGSAILKTVTLANRSRKGFFVKHFTDATAAKGFRDKAFYYQPRKGRRGAISRATDVDKLRMLGSDQAERMFVLLLAPQVGVGVAHHRHLVDGRYCTPKVGNNFALYGAWTPDGWRFSTAAFRFEPGQRRSVTWRLEVNDGDVMSRYMRYRRLPEVRRALFDYSVPEWVGDLDVFIDGMGILQPNVSPAKTVKAMGSTEQWWELFRREKLHLGIRIGIFRPHWGDMPARGVYTRHPGRTKPAVRINLDDIWRQGRTIRRGIPSVRMGQYNIFAFVDSKSRFFREHPEALIYRKDGGPDYEAKGGRPRPSDVGGWPSHLRDIGAAGVIETTARQAAEHVEAMEYDYVYIDGTVNGVSRLNWKRMAVTQTYVWIDAFHRIRQRVRQSRPEAVILTNGDTWPVTEINYWEYYHWTRRNYDWRHIAVSLPIAKIIADPRTALVPIKWNNSSARALIEEARADVNDLHYAGYVLGLGLVPMFDNLTVHMARRRVPVVRAAKELRGSEMVDAKVRPAWWRHVRPIGAEAYTLRKGGFGLIPVMSRREHTQPEEVSFDTAPLGLVNRHGLYLWVNAYQPPPGHAITSKLLYDRVFRVRALARKPKLPPRAELNLPLPGAGKGLREKTAPGPLQLIVAASVPAWVYSADGYRYQAALPEQRQVAVRPVPSRPNELQMQVTCRASQAKIFLPDTLLGGRATHVQIDYHPASTRASHWDREPGLLVDIPSGSHVLALQPPKGQQ